MPRPVLVPRELTYAPFVGRDAVAAGLITRAQLAGDAWRRRFPDIYAWNRADPRPPGMVPGGGPVPA